ncbi:hypothetical protein Tco_0358647 [Tanacetum coccineum]
MLGNKGLMLVSPQHAGFGDLKLRCQIMSPKTVDHTVVSNLTMLIRQADSSLELKGYLINDGYVDLVKLLYG